MSTEQFIQNIESALKTRFPELTFAISQTDEQLVIQTKVKDNVSRVALQQPDPNLLDEIGSDLISSIVSAFEDEISRK